MLGLLDAQSFVVSDNKSFLFYDPSSATMRIETKDLVAADFRATSAAPATKISSFNSSYPR